MINETIPFSSKKDISRKSENKKIILFGAGNIAEKTSRIIDKKQLLAIVDNSANLQGITQLDVKVQDVEYLIKNKNNLIIICTTSFREVSNQLSQLGFVADKDFIISPLLNDLRIIDDMESINKEIIFSSGSPKQDNKSYGGGIYKMKIKGDEWTYEKMINGNCYGICAYEKNFVAIDSDIGIFEFDRSFNIVRSSILPEKSRGHGVFYSSTFERFFITCSYLDAILVLDKNFEIIEKIDISKKNVFYDQPMHHCNDCYVSGNSIYVSMFSKTGNWKLDAFDGCILEIDISSKEILGSIKDNLWMPHNVSIIDGSFYVLDSLKGDLLGNNFKILGNFPAFTRGLAHDGSYFYIGQSRNRNYSKNIGLSNNISIDAGILIFDDYTKVSRFLQVSPRISEIHSIEIL